VLLSLLQRGSIVRFSEEITRLTQSVTSGAALRRSSEGVKSLYAKYLEFVNKIYFREVTPQEQGIELYKMVQENMEIERDVKALQSEIHDFFHLLDLKANEQQVEAFNTLTIIGSGLLIPSLILAYYGISEFPELQNKADFAYHWTPAITLTGMLAGLFGSWAWIQCRGQKPEIRRLAGLVLVAVLVFVFWIVIKSPQWYYEIKH
jgi:Mg2+ and Co2+ transporter CorA